MLSIRVFISLGGILTLLSFIFVIFVHCTRCFISTFNPYFFFLFSFLNCSTRYSYLHFFSHSFFIRQSFFDHQKIENHWLGPTSGKKTGGNAIKKYRQTHNSDYEAQVWVSGCVFFSKHLSRRVPNRLILSWNVLKKFKKLSSSKIFHGSTKKHLRYSFSFSFYFFFFSFHELHEFPSQQSQRNYNYAKALNR